MALSVDDREWADDQIRQYAARYSDYTRYANLLHGILTEASKVHAPFAIVQARPKSIASFAEKIWRKRPKYADPVHQLTDLCGARLIAHTADQVAAVSTFVEAHFEIDWDNSVGVMDRLKPTEFGYRSVHYVVTLRPGSFPTPDVEVKLPAKTDRMFGLKAEIQVRTVLEHAWADIGHEVAYKSDFPVPPTWERQLKALAAGLETVDRSFGQIKDGLRAYATSYASYMEKDDIRVAIDRLEVAHGVLEQLAKRRRDVGPDVRKALQDEAVQVASQIGKLALELGDPERAIEALKTHLPKDPAEATLTSAQRPILRDLGVALCRASTGTRRSKSWKEGDLYLARSSPESAPDVRALVARAQARIGIDADEVRMYYGQAFEVDPSDPYVLGGYLEHEIERDRRRLSLARSVRSIVTRAIARCRDQVEVGVNMHRAFFEMGKLYLLRGYKDDPYHAIAAYAKGVEVGSPDEIRAAQASLGRLAAAGKRIDGEDWIEGHDWAQALLGVGLVVKLGLAAEKAEQRADDAGKRARAAGLLAAEAGRAGDVEKQANAAGERDRAIAERRQAAAEQRRATEQREEALSVLRVPGGEGAVSRPVVFVVGGCDPQVEQKMKGYGDLLDEAFTDFAGEDPGTKGTIICGGTKEGVSGLVGALFGKGTDASERIDTITYYPARVPSDDATFTIDRRYGDRRPTNGETIGFSPLEPLQAWIDILRQRIDPRQVKLLGINGGRISAAEYRIALALGARVAVVEGSGRAAAKILSDDDWGTSKRLAALPDDEATVRAFIRLGKPTRLDDAQRETIAIAIHDAYRADQAKRGRRFDDPSMAPWDQLDEGLQDSNRQQGDNIDAMLAAIGYEVCRLGGADPVSLTPKQIETMSEIEHARWNVERLLNGWRLGERDPEKKLSPYLVGWAVLPDDIREWDRETVRRVPEYLVSAELAFRRTPPQARLK